MPTPVAYATGSSCGALRAKKRSPIGNFSSDEETRVNTEILTAQACPRRLRFWCAKTEVCLLSRTPSYDAAAKVLYFGTDTHNAPRRPTSDDSRLYNKYSSAIIAIGVTDGQETWVRQLVKNDVWNNAVPAYSESTGEYKDLSIGDTPKLYSLEMEGETRDVLGVGCKNGAFHVIDRQTGKIITQTTGRGFPCRCRV